jgi:hypothetical protein
LQPHHFSKHSLRTFSKKYNIISGISFKKKKLQDAVHEQKREGKKQIKMGSELSANRRFE